MLEGSKELPGEGSSFCATGKSKRKHNGIVLVARPDQQREQPAVVDWGEAIGRVTILAIIIFFLELHISRFFALSHKHPHTSGSIFGTALHCSLGCYEIAHFFWKRGSLSKTLLRAGS